MARPDWRTAIKTPLGVVPGGSGNGLAASIMHAAGEQFAPAHSAFLVARGMGGSFRAGAHVRLRLCICLSTSTRVCVFLMLASCVLVTSRLFSLCPGVLTGLDMAQTTSASGHNFSFLLVRPCVTAAVARLMKGGGCLCSR